MNPHDPLWTVDDVAAACGVAGSTVREWARLGVLAGVRLPRTWRFRREDVEAFIAARRHVPAKGGVVVEIVRERPLPAEAINAPWLGSIFGGLTNPAMRTFDRFADKNTGPLSG